MASPLGFPLPSSYSVQFYCYKEKVDQRKLESMSKNRPGTKGYLVEHIENGRPMFIVGAKDETDPKYEGPRAEVTWDDTWLNIQTDPHEGHAMLNIEALEPLRKALAKISRSIKKQESSVNGQQ